MRLWGRHAGEIRGTDRRVLTEERCSVLICLSCRREEGEVPAAIEVGSQEVLSAEGLSVVLCRVEGARVGNALVWEYLRLRSVQELVATVVIIEVAEVVGIELWYACYGVI
jgi:hypothetical protein